MTCPLFVELCAGTAAVSLRLARARARPPVSRMGAKTGYADAILGLAGLAPGQGAGHYLWCEPDPGCRLLLEAYRDAVLARAAADIIRGWAGEDPRALWERLRAEGPPRGPEASPGGQVFAHEVARQVLTAGWAFRPGHPESGFRDPYGGFSGSGSTDTITAHGMMHRLSALPALPATIAPDARQVDPREVARLLQMSPGHSLAHGVDRAFADTKPRHQLTAGCLRASDVPDRFLCEDGSGVLHPDLSRAMRHLVGDVLGLCGPREVGGAVVGLDAVEVARDHAGRPVAVEGRTDQSAYPSMNTPSSGAQHQLPVAVLVEATDQRPVGVDGLDLTRAADHVLRGFGDYAPLVGHAAPPATTISYGGGHAQLPPGTVVLLDGPYQGTTPYAHDLPRADVVALARRWAAAGALVMVCEAEPIPELLADGWGYRDIAHARKGQARTFSRQTREVVTMSRPPVHVPAEQVGLFGGAR